MSLKMLYQFFSIDRQAQCGRKQRCIRTLFVVVDFLAFCFALLRYLLVALACSLVHYRQRWSIWIVFRFSFFFIARTQARRIDQAYTYLYTPNIRNKRISGKVSESVSCVVYTSTPAFPPSLRFLRDTIIEGAGKRKEESGRVFAKLLKTDSFPSLSNCALPSW